MAREVEEANHLVVLESLEVVEHFLCVSVSTSQAPVLIAHDLWATHAHGTVSVGIVPSDAPGELESLILNGLVCNGTGGMDGRPCVWARTSCGTADFMTRSPVPSAVRVDDSFEPEVVVELGFSSIVLVWVVLSQRFHPQIPQHVILEPDSNSSIRPVASSEKASLNIPDCQSNLHLEIIRIAPRFELPTNLVVRAGNAFLLWSEPPNAFGNIGRKIGVHSLSVAVGMKTFRSCRDEPVLEVLSRAVVRAVGSAHRRPEPARASSDAFIQQVNRSCWLYALLLGMNRLHEAKRPQSLHEQAVVLLARGRREARIASTRRRRRRGSRWYRRRSWRRCRRCRWCRRNVVSLEQVDGEPAVLLPARSGSRRLVRDVEHNLEPPSYAVCIPAVREPVEHSIAVYGHPFGPGLQEIPELLWIGFRLGSQVKRLPDVGEKHLVFFGDENLRE